MLILTHCQQKKQVGDVYNLEDTGDNVAWDGNSWDYLGGTANLSEYAKTSEVDSSIASAKAELNTAFNTALNGKLDATANAVSATKATQDAAGNVITATYATKTALNAKQDTATAFKQTDADKLYLAKAGKAVSATSADSATKATQDASGNVITTTYATKSEVNTGLAGKANSSHTHTIANVTGLQDALNATSTQASNAIPKAGNRGAIAGYEQWTVVGATTTLNVSSGDALLMETAGAAATITVQAGSIGQIATKLVWVHNSNKSITINGAVGWFAGDVPTLNTATAVLLFFFHDDYVDCRLIGQWD